MTCNQQTAGRLRAMIQNISSVEIRHAFEIAAVICGAKPVVRVVLELDEISIAKSLLTELGLEVDEASEFLGIDKATSLGDQWTMHVQRDDPRATYAVVFAAREQSIATFAARQEGTASAFEIGHYLGYPSCCLQHYSLIEAGDEWLTLLLEDHRRKGDHPSFLTNKIAYLFDGLSFLPDYFPCSLHCAGAREMAANLRASALTCGLDDFVDETERSLRRPIVVWRDLIIQPQSAQKKVCAWKFDGATSSWFDRRPPKKQLRSLLALVAGCEIGVAGLDFLDREGKAIADTRDPSGQIILFE